MGAVWLAACAGDLEHPKNFAFLRGGDAAVDGAAGGGNEPPACVQTFFENTCGGPCHGAEAALLDLTSPGVEGRLVNMPSSVDSVCKDRTLISTDGSPSLLMEKLEGPTCGSKMPFGGDAEDADIACVRSWVESLGGGGNDDGGA